MSKPVFPQTGYKKFREEMIEKLNKDLPFEQTGKMWDALTKEEKDFYEVEQIIDKRMLANGTLEYQIKWLGYGETDNTWEPQSNLDSCIKMVHDFDTYYNQK